MGEDEENVGGVGGRETMIRIYLKHRDQGGFFHLGKW